MEEQAGRGIGEQGNTSPNCYGGGGAGNKGGEGTYSVRYSNLLSWEEGNGENGTGGLLTIYADTLYNKGEITSDGSAGGGSIYGYTTGGGGSGAGSINIFAKELTELGETRTKGGAGRRRLIPRRGWRRWKCNNCRVKFKPKLSS